jgi:DNA repair exonuclease SbcCD ATPase subunit
MIITHIAVEGVGRFRGRHVVRGLGPGLNLLCAPNEAGKSTIFRAVQACLFARHDANTKETRALGCIGAQLSARVEVGFKCGDADYRVEKAFLRSNATRLHKNDRLIAEGRAADEALWSTLDLSPGARSFEDSAFGLLWVRQGQSFEPVKPSGEGQALLSRMIEAEVGKVLGGERGERVFANITAQLALEETKTGLAKTGGAWKAALERAEEARRALDNVRATLASLEADRDALAAKLRERDGLADASALAQMQADLNLAMRERDTAIGLDQAAQKAATEAARCELAHERASDKHQRLIALDQRIAATRVRIGELDRKAQEEEAALNAQATALTGQEEAFAELGAQLAVAEREADLARARELAAQDAERLADLDARLKQARELRDRINLLQQTFALVNVAPDALRRIEQAARDLEAAQSRRAAKAPQVAIRLGPDGVGRVTCAGEAMTGPRDIAALEPLRIEIAEIASIEIAPAATPEDAQSVNRAREKLERELVVVGAASLAEARERRAKADDIVTEQRGLAAELAMIAPAANGKDGVALLEKALCEAQAKLAAFVGAAPDCSDRDALREQRCAAEQTRDALRREHHELQGALLASRNGVAAEKMRLAAFRGDREAAQEKLAEDLALCPDEERPHKLIALAAEAAQARALFEQAQAEATRLHTAVPSSEQRAAVEARVKRLTQAIAARHDRLQEVERDIAGLRGRIESRGGEDLGERESALADALALAEKERARIERRLAALRLLRDTIEACRREARETSLAPVKRAMQPYLQTLFPGADAELDEHFSIGGVQRSGTEIEPFGSLSDGTREQIAIIVRLAFGRLLAERGQPTPIVLDDSLVFSDDERIERMFDVLMQAAEKQQVIVLTCRSRAFQNCGGRPLAIEPDASPQTTMDLRAPLRLVGIR